MRGATVVSDWAACSSPAAYDLPPSPTAPTPSRCARPTPPATPARRPASSYTLDRSAPAAPSIDSRPPSPGNDATPTWAFSAEAGAALECRVDARRGSGRGLGGLPEPADGFDLSPSPTAATPSRCAPPTPRATPARPPAPTTSSTPPPRRAIDRLAPAVAGHRPQPRLDFSGEAGATFECRLDARRDRGVRLGGLLGPARLRPARASRTAPTPSRCARDRRGRQHGAAATSDYELDTTAPAAPSIDSAPAVARATTPRRPGRSRARRAPRSSAAWSAAPRRSSDWAACTTRDVRPLRRARRQLHASRCAPPTPPATPAPRPPPRPTTSTRTRPGAPSIDAAPGHARQRPLAALVLPGEAGAAFECRLDAAPRPSPAGRPARPARASTCPPSPTASYTSRCAPATPRATPAPRPRSDYDARHDGAGRALDRRLAALAGQRRHARLVLLRRGRRDARVPPRARRHRRVRLGRLRQPAGYDLRRSPTATTPSSCARPTPRATRARPPSSDYTLDSSDPAVPSIDSTPGVAGQRRQPGLGASRARPAPRFECRLDRGATRRLRLGRLLEPGPSTSGRARWRLHLLGARARRRRQHQRARHERLRARPLRSGRADDQLGSRIPGNDAAPELVVQRRGGRVVRVPPDRGASVVSDWAPARAPKASTSPGSPTATTPSRCAPADAAGNTGAVSSSDYELDTSAPARPRSTRPPHRRAPRPVPAGPSPARPARPSSAASSAAPPWSPTGRLLQPAGLRHLGGAGRQPTASRCAPRDAAGNTGARSELQLRARPHRRRGADRQRAGRRRQRPLAAVGLLGRAAAPASSAASSAAARACRRWAACTSPQGIRPARRAGRRLQLLRAGDRLAGQPGRLRRLGLRARHLGSGRAHDHRPSPPRRAPTAAPPGRSRGEAGAALECRLEGAGAVVSDWGACSSPQLIRPRAGRPDGRYTLSVRATDAAGNTGPAGGRRLRAGHHGPEPPEITAGPGPRRQGRHSRLGVPRRAGRATSSARSRGAAHDSGAGACASPQGYDLGSEPDGDYRSAPAGADAAGNLSAAATADYELDRTEGTATAARPGRGRPRRTPRPPGGLRPAGATVRKPGRRWALPAPAGEPSTTAAEPSGRERRLRRRLGGRGDRPARLDAPSAAPKPEDEGGSPVLKRSARPPAPWPQRGQVGVPRPAGGHGRWASSESRTASTATIPSLGWRLFLPIQTLSSGPHPPKP